ncbi:MAG: hypothetical protein JNK95_07315 [Candidatus Competibacter sp.]|nr:hypothetical protein [Candidatus Competibacter sp.]HRD49922.1 hypothetical protein [Candidatus Contendobacter sp.]
MIQIQPGGGFSLGACQSRLSEPKGESLEIRQAAAILIGMPDLSGVPLESWRSLLHALITQAVFHPETLDCQIRPCIA